MRNAEWTCGLRARGPAPERALPFRIPHSAFRILRPMTARDPALSPIAEKVERAERLTHDDALALFHSPDLLTIGRLADQANRRRNGDRVFFAANQHINPTNVCVLRNTCVFCSFARMPQEAGAYTRSLDEVFAEADAARDNPTREFHIVGGLHQNLRLADYLGMVSGLRRRKPVVDYKVFQVD